MSDEAIFLIYAILFRFGIIAAGLYTIFLGYQLLREVPASEAASHASNATAEATLPGAKIALKNVTTGTIFSLFGAFLVVAMVLQGNPEKTVQKETRQGMMSETEKLRGDSGDPIANEIQSGLDLAKSGQNDEAEGHFRKALFKVAPALNGIAWIYSREGKPTAALHFAQAATEIDGNDAHYLDTLAEAQFDAGDRESALRTIDRAVSLDPQFTRRADELRRRAK